MWILKGVWLLLLIVANLSLLYGSLLLAITLFHYLQFNEWMVVSTHQIASWQYLLAGLGIHLMAYALSRALKF